MTFHIDPVQHNRLRGVCQITTVYCTCMYDGILAEDSEASAVVEYDENFT